MKLSIKNFRSIKDQEIELAPITVVYGANGAGKSSLLYAPLTLFNALRPDQKVHDFFRFDFGSLGEFSEVIYDHKKDTSIQLGLSLNEFDVIVTYSIEFDNKKGKWSISISDSILFENINLELEVTFPYLGDQKIKQFVTFRGAQQEISWNGIIGTYEGAGPGIASITDAINRVAGIDSAPSQLIYYINKPIKTLHEMTIVPLKRGFTKPFYFSKTESHEDELAKRIADDKYLIAKISNYLNNIFDRDFRVNSQLVTGVFTLDVINKFTGLQTDLVNDGFGVNQIVHLLAVCLNDDTEWVCVEEPEIHLHPSGIRDLARVLVQIVHNEGKKFIISTHSESFLAALLAQVVEGSLKSEELACYLAKKENKETIFERQQVNEKGQIEGGLSSFLEGELKDLEIFFKGRK